jgi:hypothetical protein
MSKSHTAHITLPFNLVMRLEGKSEELGMSRQRYVAAILARALDQDPPSAAELHDWAQRADAAPSADLEGKPVINSPMSLAARARRFTTLFRRDPRVMLNPLAIQAWGASPASAPSSEDMATAQALIDADQAKAQAEFEAGRALRLREYQETQVLRTQKPTFSRFGATTPL